MIVYNHSNTFGNYKIRKHTKFNAIKKQSVKVSTSSQLGVKRNKKIRKFIPLREENIKFLGDLGYKVN